MHKKSFLGILLFLIVCLDIHSQINLSSFQNGRSIFLRFKENENDSLGYVGTGFCILKDSSLYLLTNRHMIDEDDFYIHKVNKPYSRYLDYSISVNDLTYTKTKLIRKYNNNYFTYGQLNNKPTDIVAIKINNFKNKQLLTPVDYKLTEDLKIGDEVFFITSIQRDKQCYQFLTMSKVYAYTNAGYNDSRLGLIPAFLIDKPTMHGTSGSPVFLWRDKSKLPILVGIVGANTEDGRGIIWKKEIITTLINQLQE